MTIKLADQIELFYLSADATYHAMIRFNGVVYTSTSWYASQAVAILHAIDNAQLHNPNLTLPRVGELPIRVTR